MVSAIMLGVFQPPTQLFVFILLLNYAMPTAVNMSVCLFDGRVQAGEVTMRPVVHGCRGTPV